MTTDPLDFFLHPEGQMISDTLYLLQNERWSFHKFWRLATSAEPNWVEEAKDKEYYVFQVCRIFARQSILADIQSQKWIGVAKRLWMWIKTLIKPSSYLWAVSCQPSFEEVKTLTIGDATETRSYTRLSQSRAVGQGQYWVSASLETAKYAIEN